MRAVKNAEFDVDLMLYLIHSVVYNDATQNCCIKSAREDWAGLPRSKSLFYTEKGKGFPIGNLTSQLFANIYLDEFDHFFHEEMGVKYYGRYVDDMVFVDKERDFLKSVIVKAQEYLHTELGLEVHPKKMYLQHYKKGVYFLGTFIKPWRIYIGKRTKQNFYDTVSVWNKVAVENNGLATGKESAQFISAVNSYLGIMKHYNTYTLREKIVKNFDEKILGSLVVSQYCDKVKWVYAVGAQKK